ncbi:MAG: DNA internalization-related competence protein ComEC/Rec2, partial [Desulfobacteraceae bacterium]|nr:DNA internalization-related competence protein ComEC/Rec2 [Desulfobacteraceae bacterium]
MKKREITLNPPLAVPALLLALGIIAGNIIVSYSSFAFITSILSLLLFLYCKNGANFKSFIFLFIFIFSTGFISIIPHLPQNFGKKQISEYFGEKELQIFGIVDSKPKHKNIRTKLVLKIVQIKSKKSNKAKKVTGRIDLYSYRGTPKLQYGDLICFKGSIKKPRNFSNPGGFNYIKYLSFKGVSGVSYISGNKIRICDKGNQQSLSTKWIRKVNQIRGDFSEFINKSTGNDKAASILSALTTGLRDSIPDKLKDDFSKTGASHILAISGLHLSIVTAIFFFMFNSLFSCFKPLLIRGLAGKYAAMATLIPLLFYACLSGFSPSTKRAFIMISIYMFSFVIEREKDVLNSLAAAAIIILLIDPCALFAISFQLSFSAVLFIVLGLYATRDMPFFQKKNLLSKLCMFMIVSFSAGLGTMPLVMHYFNIVSFVQLATNLVIIPTIGFIIVPLGLSALFIFPFSEVIAAFLIKISIPVLSFSISFVEYLSLLSFTWAKCVTPHLIEIICYYAFILGAFLVVLKKNKKGIYIIVFSILIFAGHTGFVVQQRYFNKNLQVTVLDVGQGSSALIEGPEGTIILVDGGGFSYSSTFDTGRHIVAPFLWNKKILMLDAVILTHPEKDHMNGLVYIVENFHVKQLIKNFDTRETESYRDLMKICSQKNMPIIEFPHEKENEIELGDMRIS